LFLLIGAIGIGAAALLAREIPRIDATIESTSKEKSRIDERYAAARKARDEARAAVEAENLRIDSLLKKIGDEEGQRLNFSKTGDTPGIRGAEGRKAEAEAQLGTARDVILPRLINRFTNEEKLMSELIENRNNCYESGACFNHIFSVKAKELFLEIYIPLALLFVCFGFGALGVASIPTVAGTSTPFGLMIFGGVLAPLLVYLIPISKVLPYLGVQISDPLKMSLPFLVLSILISLLSGLLVRQVAAFFYGRQGSA